MSIGNDHKRTRRKKAKDERNLRRQQRLAAPLGTRRGHALQRRVNAFVSDFRHDQDATDFPEILTIIDELNLVHLEDHKYGISQAIVSIYRMFPQHQRGWMHDHRKVLSPALHLIPPEEEDLEITCPVDIDRRMVHWMITGDEAAAMEVYELAKDGDTYAARTFNWYLSQHPDLEIMVEDHTPEPYRAPVVTEAAAVAHGIDLHGLATNKAGIAFITQHEGQWVVAVDQSVNVAEMATSLPQTHQGLLVTVRHVLPQEQELITNLRDDMEEPL